MIINEMLKEVLFGAIVPHLSLQDCEAMTRVSLQWRSVFNEALDEKLYDHVVFDEKKWRQVPGVESVSEYKVDPEKKGEYIKKLKLRCDVFNEPDVTQPHRFQKSTNNWFWQTHKVILFPEKINGQPVNINSIGKLFSFEKENNTGTVFNYINGREDDEYRNLSLQMTFYLEVSLDIVPGSRKPPYEVKAGLVKSKNCRVPTPLEALISNVVINIGSLQKKEGYYFGTGKVGEIYTFTMTDMKIKKNWRLVVGAASPAGLRIIIDYGDPSSIGVMAVKQVL